MQTFEKIWENIVNSIFGFYERQEAEAMYHLAKDSLNKEGDFVEIGSFYGRTAILLGNIIKESEKKKKLYIVEPLFGNPEFEEMHIDLAIGEQMGKILLNNIYKNKLDNEIRICIGTSRDFSRFEIPISFLHIDGSHKSEDLLFDLNNWIPKIVVGGICFCHDYNNLRHPNVRQIIDSFFEKNVKFQKIEQQNKNVVAFRRVDG